MTFETNQPPPPITLPPPPTPWTCPLCEEKCYQHSIKCYRCGLTPSDAFDVTAAMIVQDRLDLDEDDDIVSDKEHLGG